MKNKKLTPKQTVFLQYFINHPHWISPTKMGLDMGYDYNSASARVIPVLKKLVSLGLIKRNSKGHYCKVGYCW